MSLRLRETSIELEVPFHDVDISRVVWHGHYYKYFELARTALLRSVDLDGGDPTGAGHSFLVIESHCRYVHPLRYGERARVAAWFREIDRRIGIGYEIRNLSAARRSARGHTVLVSVDDRGRMLWETPDAIRQRIAG